MSYLATSESVGCGHPDKICDQISDAILDHILEQDKYARVAIETLCKSNVVILAGEITANAVINYREVVKGVIKRCGYDFGDVFDCETFELRVLVNEQSQDISNCVGPNSYGPEIVVINDRNDIIDFHQHFTDENEIDEKIKVPKIESSQQELSNSQKENENSNDTIKDIAYNCIVVSSGADADKEPTNSEEKSNKETCTNTNENQNFIKKIRNVKEKTHPSKLSVTASTSQNNKEKENIDINEDNKNIIDRKNKLAAGDQGVMFGFACTDTPEFMPLPHVLATKIVQLLNNLSKVDSRIKTDCKAQVTIEYEEDKPKRIHAVVASVHTQDFPLKDLRVFLIQRILEILPKELLDKTQIIAQPSNNFSKGGPTADCGLTGRKIVCDAYGSAAMAGGGCFSGKDASKVDRSGAYMARFIAKNLVANKLCKKAIVQISYAIGMHKPIGVSVSTFNTGVLSDEKLTEIIEKNFDCSVGEIVARLGLREPIFGRTAVYGHFGHEEYPWEKVIKINY